MSGHEVMKSKFSDRRKISGRVSVAKKVVCIEVISLCENWKSWKVLLYSCNQRVVCVCKLCLEL